MIIRAKTKEFRAKYNMNQGELASLVGVRRGDDEIRAKTGHIIFA